MARRETNTMASKEEILEKFVEWFDANAVGEKFDGFIRENAGDFAGASSEGEQELSRMELYKRYQAVFDELPCNLVPAACAQLLRWYPATPLI